VLLLPITLVVSAVLCQSLLPSHGWQTATAAPKQVGRQAVEPATPLAFSEFFEPAPGELKASAKLLGLDGRRVRLVGFMAQMEEPPDGAFYLCPRPVFCDESGGGTAALPPEAVRVVVRSAQGKKISFIPHALEVTGLLEVGHHAAEDGQVAPVRLILDRPPDSPHSPKPSRKKIKNRNHRSS